MNDKRYLDKEEINRFINENFSSTSEFCRKLGVSRSHLYKMLKKDIACGSKTQHKLKRMLRNYCETLEDLLEPLPICIGDDKYKEIVIVDSNDKLIASINSVNEISDKDYRIEYIPYC